MKTAEQILGEKQKQLISVDVEVSVFDALKVMNESRIGAIIVKQGDALVGIWTERDLLKNSVLENFDPKTAKLKDHMSTSLKYCGHNETLYQLQDKFLGMRLRHLLVQKNGEFIGILTPGDIMKTLLNEKEQELKKLNAMIGWEYYENWRWEKKKC